MIQKQTNEKGRVFLLPSSCEDATETMEQKVGVRQEVKGGGATSKGAESKCED